jgi:hypothetical protein
MWAFSNGWSPGKNVDFGDDFKHMRVTANKTLWQTLTFQSPDVLGLVIYDPKEEYGKQLAEETARLMKAGRGLNDIRDHIAASATAANILVQMTNEPLDVIVSFQEAYQERTVRSFLSAALSMVPFVPGSIIRKSDDLADLGKAEEMAKAESRHVTVSKKVPNPYGKLGGPAHRAKVQEVINDIQSRGLQPQAEVIVDTVGGQKQTRVMDVVAIDPSSGRIVEVHQIGLGLKGNPLKPVSRERDALRDVRYAESLRDAKRFFHNYLL